MAKIGCLKPFRGSASALANIVLEDGEIAFDTTNKQIYMGNGTDSVSSLSPFISNNGGSDIRGIKVRLAQFTTWTALSQQLYQLTGIYTPGYHMDAIYNNKSDDKKSGILNEVYSGKWCSNLLNVWNGGTTKDLSQIPFSLLIVDDGVGYYHGNEGYYPALFTKDNTHCTITLM